MQKLYRYTRTNIETGDVFGTASPALFSRIIRLFTKSKISHTGVFLWIENRLFICEMLEWKGCRLIPASNRFSSSFYWGKTTTKLSEKEIISNCLDDVGRVEYSMIGAILAPFIDTSSSNNICSEFTAKVIDWKFPSLTRWILPIDVMNKCDNVSLITM